MAFRNCGETTEKELVSLCKEYKTNSVIVETKTVEDISLKELSEIEWLSARAITSCNNANLTSLNEILDFYEKRGSFIGIRNCGAQTAKELTELCEKYKHKALTIEIKENVKILD